MISLPDPGEKWQTYQTCLKPPPSTVLIPKKSSGTSRPELRKDTRLQLETAQDPATLPFFQNFPKSPSDFTPRVHVGSPRWWLVVTCLSWLTIPWNPCMTCVLVGVKKRPCFEGLFSPTFTVHQGHGWARFGACTKKLGDFPFRPNHHPFFSRWVFPPKTN